MELLELTCRTVAEDLALDEALLDDSEQQACGTEWLRIWQPEQYAVVVGRGSRLADEIGLAACRERGIPVLRRASGGAAVVIGPGCLLYSLVLSIPQRVHLVSIDRAHRFVLEAMASALRRFHPGVRCAGTSDLAIDGRKFSGNSLRWKRTRILYHGTLLYDFPLSLITQCLAEPPRQPAYRSQRAHQEFLINLPATAQRLRDAVVECWQPVARHHEIPWSRAQQLWATRYSQPDWNLGR